MSGRFVHLHTHSHYSLLNALPKVPDLVAAAKNDGMPSLALTDAGNLYGAIEFYKECQKQDIKPIIGLDAYVATRTRFDKEPRIDSRRYRLILLAENLAGYQNLIKLVTDSYLEGFYYKPRVDKELLERHHDGLIAILPSFSGEVAMALRDNDIERAKAAATWYRDTFGADNTFLELTHHPEIDGHETTAQRIVSFSKDSNIPLVAAHDVYYLDIKDRLARETMARIQTNGDGGDRSLGDEDFSFITQEKAATLFKDTPEALENTIKIANRCDLEIPMTWKFPNYVIESGRSPDDELRHLAFEGLDWRGLEKTDALLERLEYELDIIKTKGYATYFLVVGDLLREARKREILTTIRGSVAGSLTTYVLGITNVDPIEYQLPFERFLNPERPSAPDIDMDFADNRRDEMIEYAREKYGRDKVAQIGTFGTMMARAAVRDVARALGHPYALGDQIAKLIPFGSQGFPMTIENALEITPELKALYKKNKDAKEVIDLAQKIEGCARHISVHAAGVVISPDPLTEHVPLQYDPKGGHLITQYNMHAVGEDGVGLLKFDFLGIKNLSILADSVKRTKEHSGVEVDIENVPLDDQKTFEMLARGETMGLFQLNGSGMTRFLKELKPSTIHDINAMVALYRPGPMESIPAYIERKHNPQLATFLDPRMRDILNRSYGVITYQDDVLLIAVRIGGYSWLEADKLRKAMGKKIPAEMEAQKEKLIDGAVQNGLEQAKAERLWKLIEPFAAYGFNKAHAASYGKVAYQTAYMKANFSVEYMAALLSADSGDTDKVAEAIAECTRMGINVLPPDINESFGDFTIVEHEGGDAIRFGLFTIKNFGEGVATTIIEEREQNGKFASLSDFLARINDKNLNRKSLEALIKCGAFDELGEERGAMLEHIEDLLAWSRESANTPANQDSLFGALPEKASGLSLTATAPASTEEKLSWEKELLGVYVSGHPLEKFRERLEKQRSNISTLDEHVREGVTTVIAGIIEEIREILTKKGDKMAFIKLADFSGSIELVAFPRVLAEYHDKLSADRCIAVKGHYSKRNGTPSIIIEAVKDLV